MSNTEETLLCKCGKEAIWLYMPGDDSIENQCCDDCVPRNCEFCNSDDDGNPNPKPWQPCCEWMLRSE